MQPLVPILFLLLPNMEATKKKKKKKKPIPPSSKLSLKTILHATQGKFAFLSTILITTSSLHIIAEKTLVYQKLIM